MVVALAKGSSNSPQGFIKGQRIVALFMASWKTVSCLHGALRADELGQSLNAAWSNFKARRAAFNFLTVKTATTAG
jgi:hypothetical protein